MTTIAMTSDDGSEVAHVVFVGTADDYQFDLEELFEHIEVIEAYRLGRSRSGVRLALLGALDDALGGLRALLVGLPGAGVEVEEDTVVAESLVRRQRRPRGRRASAWPRRKPPPRRHGRQRLRPVQHLDHGRCDVLGLDRFMRAEVWVPAINSVLVNVGMITAHLDAVWREFVGQPGRQTDNRELGAGVDNLSRARRAARTSDAMLTMWPLRRATMSGNTN